MPVPTEWEWRAYAAIRGAYTRVDAFTETALDEMFDGELAWAAAMGIDEIERQQDGGEGENAWSDAHKALGQAKALLLSIDALADRAKDVHGKKRDELANAVAWLACTVDELADAEAPNRWAARRAP